MSASSSGKAEVPPVKGIELALDNLIQGLTAAAAAGLTQLTVRGTVRTVADLLSSAQAVEKPWKDIRAARAVIRGAVQARPADLTTAKQFRADVKASLVSQYGAESQELSTFGFKPKQAPAKQTTEQKALSSAKRTLTRQMRHTMGSRQKAGLRAAETPVVTIGPDGTTITPPASAPVASTPNPSPPPAK